MLFNSFGFIFIFLPATFFVYFYLRSTQLVNAPKVWLISASLLFYGWSNFIYLPLILSSILFNFFISKAILKFDLVNKQFLSKKNLLKVGIISNIGLLIYFKYMNFFITNVNSVFSSNIDLLNIILPLAISFFTLQQIIFLVDSYEDLVKEKSFLNYLLFITFFPQLILGPIVHHHQMMPQFEDKKNYLINYKNISLGIFIFSIGLFKKVVIADSFEVFATQGFDVANTLNFFEAWVTSLSYTFQLYFDFSGYMDMAVGIALIFNIQIPQNFNSPFKASGIIDFWQRWHITLSNFITTYIYTPIVMSFKNLNIHKAMLATFLAFLIAGLWHGASWMFVIFGSLHGIGLVTNQYWNKYWKKKFKINLNFYLAWFITFNYVNIANVFFRARDWSDASKVINSMFSVDNIVIPSLFENKLIFLSNYGMVFGEFLNNIGGNNRTILWILITLIIVLFFKNSMELLKTFKPSIWSALLTLFFLIYSILNISKNSSFIYFNF